MTDHDDKEKIRIVKDQTTNPADATNLQAGVDQILVDHELEQGRMVKIPQPRRKRVVFKY